MDSLLSFPVGLFHPLQHAGLSRRSPVSRRFRKCEGHERRSNVQYFHTKNCPNSLREKGMSDAVVVGWKPAATASTLMN
jgi:hypothetical protein